MPEFNIMLVEDHVLVREGIRGIIEENPAYRVVAETGDGLEALQILKTLPVNLAVLDITVPGLSGIEVTKQIKRHYPDCKVLILTVHNNQEFLKYALAAGTDGYVSKQEAAKELLGALEAIRQGGMYISPLMSPQLTGCFQEGQPSRQSTGPDRLTSRDLEIIKLIAEGKTSKEIAGILSLSFRTVQNHRLRIMKKLHLNKNTELVKYALRQGLILPPG